MLERTCTFFEAPCSWDCSTGCFPGKLRCKSGMFGLVWILIEKERRSHQHFKLNRIHFTARVLLVLTITPLASALHRTLRLLKKPSAFVIWGLVKKYFWLVWAFRALEKYPLCAHCVWARWTIWPGSHQSKGLRLLMTDLLVAVVLHSLKRKVLSGYNIQFQRSRILEKQTLTTMQVRLI